MAMLHSREHAPDNTAQTLSLPVWTSARELHMGWNPIVYQWVRSSLQYITGGQDTAEE